MTEKLHSGRQALLSTSNPPRTTSQDEADPPPVDRPAGAEDTFDTDGICAELLPIALRQPKVDYARPTVARSRMARAFKLAVAFRPAVVDAVETSDRLVDVGAGHPPVPVRVYQPPRDGAPVPGLVFFHGGGFVVGGLDTEDERCREYARRLGIVVLSVDYRLAPEHPYPAAFDDCYRSVRWLSANAASLGVDPNRIAVGGTSAGGALAAAVALAARDRGDLDIAFQMLLYPVIDDRLATWSMSRCVATPGWNQPNSVHMWRHYLGDRLGGDVPAYAAPGRADDLRGLPPAYVMTIDRDPLRDEGVDYALRLVAADVPTELHNVPGAFHGFDAAHPMAALSRRSRYEQCAVLARATGLRPPAVEDGVAR